MPSRTIDGLDIHFQRKDSESDAGQRVLFVHGTGCNGRLWQRPMKALAAAGHSSVAIDLPGHGGSAGDGFRGVADHGHFVARLAERLGWDRYVVAGHSLGGGVALAVSIYDREPLLGMMLIDTGARLRVHPGILESARRTAAGEDPPVGNPRQGYAADTPQAVIDEIRALRSDERADVTYRDWIADDSCDFLSRVGTIDVPTLALCGAEDPLTPVKYHQFLHDRMPDCRLEVIGGAGHWPQFEQPEAFDRAVLTFLETLG